VAILQLLAWRGILAGLTLLLGSPVTVLGPGLALASLVIGLNLFTEGLARVLGRTVRLGSQ
jgi:peptide/nickel transport system permease protein